MRGKSILLPVVLGPILLCSATWTSRAGEGDLLLTIANPEPPTLVGDDQFGRPVAAGRGPVSGWERIAVGARLDDADPDGAGPLPPIRNTGSAYVFNVAGSLLFTLGNPDLASANPATAQDDQFGSAVAVGDVTGDGIPDIIVGAPLDDLPGRADAGSVSVFDGAHGLLIRKIPNPSPTTGDMFGFAVAVGDLNADGIADLLVGAPSPQAGDVGKAFAFAGTTGALITAILNPAPNAADEFGLAVTVLGGHAVVAAPLDDTTALNAGTVYVLSPTAPGGALVSTIPNPAPATGDQFGASVKAMGALLVVGAPLDDAGAMDAGTVYAFSPDVPTGTRTRTIPNPNPDIGDQFGSSLDIDDVDGDGFVDIMVGVPLDDMGDFNAGAAYVFDGSPGGNATPLLVLTNPAPEKNDRFGFSVATLQGNVIAGAPTDNPRGAPDSGSIYIRRPSGIVDAIVNPTLGVSTVPTGDDAFGIWLAEVRGHIAVGAPLDDPQGTSDAGSVYVFDKETGDLLLAIPNPDLEEDARFGLHLAPLRGDLVVGAPFAMVAGFANAGAVYVVSGETGDLLLRIENPFPFTDDQFGRWVTARGDDIVVGAPLADAGGVRNAGRAYVFDGQRGTLLLTLENPDLASPIPLAAEDDQFGVVAALHRDIVVGAPQDDRGAQNAGTVYVFNGSTGALRLAIPNPHPGAGDFMPVWVPVPFGDDLVVDLMFDSDPDGDAGPVPNVFQQGSVYVFDGRTGETRLTIPDPFPERRDMFSAVTALGQDLLIGAMGDNDPDGPGHLPRVTQQGSAFLFDGRTGELMHTFANPVPRPFDFFGQAVATVGGDVLIGAPGADRAGISNTGEVYLFDWGQ